MKRPLVSRAFGALARCLPRPFSADDAEAMCETFDRRWTQSQRSVFGSAWFLSREFAGLAWVICRESARLASVQHHLGGLSTEVRHAGRRLRRSPGFTTVVLATTTTAIAVNIAVFTLLHRVVLAPLPYPDADRLVAVDHDAPGVGLTSIGLSLGLYWEYAALPSVDAIALYYTGEQTLTGVGVAERMSFLHTTPQIGNILGIRAAYGRWFTDADGVRGAAPVVFLSHALWTRRFGASPTVIGTSVTLDGVRHEVVGVGMPGELFPDSRIAYAVPLRLTPAMRRASGFNYEGVARLRPGATLEQLRREQDQVLADIPTRFRADPEVAVGLLAEGRLTSSTAPLKDHIIGDTGRLVWLLVGAGVLTLVVALANLTNLVLVRVESRGRELAIRRALGGGTRAIAASVMTEAFVVAGLAGLAGASVAYVALKTLIVTGPFNWPRLSQISFDTSIGAFALALTVAVGLILGIVPLLRRTPQASAVMRATGRGMTDGRRARLVRNALLASQVAAAFVLMLAAALLAKGASQLKRVDPGFAPDSRLVVEVGLPRAPYRAEGAAAQFHERLLEDLTHVPGVRSVATTTNLPLEGRGMTNPIEVFGQTPSSITTGLTAGYRQVSPDYFDTIRIPMVAGRRFAPSDVDVTVVNQAFADAHFPGDSPLGKQVRPTNDGPWLTIIGVVGNTATENLREPVAISQFYVPGSTYHQIPYVLWTNVEPAAMIAAVRQLVTARDPDVVITRAEPLTAIVDRSNADVTFVTSAFVTSAAIALMLGLVGVFGVVAYVVSQRRNEIGVRLALGATPANVMAALARETAITVGAGLGVGMAVSIVAGPALQSWLFAVSPRDPATYAGSIGAIIVCAALACWWPARRVAAIDPVQALRSS